MRLAISIVVLATALIAPAGAAGQAGVTYQVPPDNPFVATAGAAPEVYAYGLRNPWRFSFDRLTGALLIGDVGASAREEIDWIGYREARGANFGWPCREGKVAGPVRPPDSRCPASAPAYVEPLFDFRGSAVTAGFVVRDTSLTGLVGRALFADFYPGQIRSLALGPGGHGDSSAGEAVSNLASFGEDAAGHLYVADLDGNQVRRLIAGSAPGALDSVPLAAPSGAPWDQPIAIAPVPGEAGSLFVAERPGRVRLVVSGKVRSEAILEIPGSPGVQSGGERGLLSVAFPPDY
ncbi:MAG: PQQ-dependent sugar dehydrogenase, partial [Thermoleophilaceae bacterium]